MSKHTKQTSGLPGLLENAFTHNVVLVQAVGLCPILSAGTTLKNGVALSVCMAAVMLLLSVPVAGMVKKTATWVRPMLYALAAALILTGCAFLIRRYISPELYAKLYLFIPLIAVNAMTARSVGLAGTPEWRETFSDALGSTVGFSLVICILSALREAAINGTVWDKPLGFASRFPEAAAPFAAFILLGFAAALLQNIRRRAARRIDARKGADET